MKALFITVLGLGTYFFLPKSDPVTEVKAALQSQVDAWNKADLEKAMNYYWHSDSVVWINAYGVTKGFDWVWEDYKKMYSDKSKMGYFSYTPLHIEKISDESVMYVYKWKIEHEGVKKMGGISSQIWRKIKGSWVITSEHAS
jgi:hypothetical protein